MRFARLFSLMEGTEEREKTFVQPNHIFIETTTAHSIDHPMWAFHPLVLCWRWKFFLLVAIFISLNHHPEPIHTHTTRKNSMNWIEEISRRFKSHLQEDDESAPERERGGDIVSSTARVRTEDNNIRELLMTHKMKCSVDFVFFFWKLSESHVKGIGSSNLVDR